MAEIHSTVGKRAKRMPDATVETTWFTRALVNSKKGNFDFDF